MGMVLGRELVAATPQTVAEVNGQVQYTPTVPVVEFWCSIQPPRPIQIQQLPEGARKSARWILYPEGVPALDEDTPYRITCTKGTLMPVGFVDLAVHTTGLPHKAPICMEEGTDE